MHIVDTAIIIFYFAFVIAIGLFFFRRQESIDEYFVGNRRMSTLHIGLSVVATDVGGGFSIGLGGLGYAIGLAGNWLLFTGLVGAILSATIVVPRVWRLGSRHLHLTYPEYLEHRFDGRLRLAAAIVSALGYAAFVGSQVLAGAKLSAAAFDIPLTTAVLAMAVVIVVYTALGGLQAVVYTDTLQWIVLLAGLLFAALPFAWNAVGGLEGLTAALPPSHFDPFAVSGRRLAMWAFSIVPIWFIAMTLYQRIYATQSEKTAKRAWYLAGFLEWPLMAFLGVTLGMMSRVLFPAVDPEMGLPLLIREILPVGIAGIVMAAYFSAIMSTADSCLLASVGNVANDLYHRFIDRGASESRVLMVGRLLTIAIGMGSVILALTVPTVLDAILLSYSFMVSGLFAPTLGGLIWKRVSTRAALASLLAGGGAFLLLSFVPQLDPFSYPIFLSLPTSFVALVAATMVWPNTAALTNETARS